jgi:serine/threonine protein phosphatase PrpC
VLLWVLTRGQTDADMASADVGYSGSTVAAAFVQTVADKRLLHTANCGDARIVLCRNGQAQRLTVDHKARTNGEKAAENS